MMLCPGNKQTTHPKSASAYQECPLCSRGESHHYSMAGEEERIEGCAHSRAGSM